MAALESWERWDLISGRTKGNGYRVRCSFGAYWPFGPVSLAYVTEELKMEVFMYFETYTPPGIGPPEQQYGWLPRLYRFGGPAEWKQWFRQQEEAGKRFRNIAFFGDQSAVDAGVADDIVRSD